MARTSLLRYWQLAWFSGSPCERRLLRQVARRRPGSILEIGLGLASRTLRMFETAGRYAERPQLHYTGIDLFEGRENASAALPLKDAYKLLRLQGVPVRLIPGEAAMALKLVATTQSRFDLIVIDADISDAALAGGWTSLERVMHEKSLLVRQHLRDGAPVSEELDIKAVRARIAADPGSKRAA